MDEKLERLIAILRKEGSITPDELARRLGVSVRTVRTYVNRVNALLANADRGREGSAQTGRIEMHSASVYRLSSEDDSTLAALAHQEQDSVRASDAYAVPATSEERISYLINDLLNRADWITIDDLAQILFVSRSTVSEDLKEVGERLARFDLSLERRPRYGIRVNGSELKRRLCLAANVAEGSAEGQGGEPFAAEIVAGIDECVREAIDSTDFQINSIAYQNLLVHIAVAVMRIRENCYVPMEREQLERILQSREFPVAREVAQRIEARFAVQLPVEEVAYISIHLAGRQRLFFSDDAPENSLVISDEVWDVVRAMVERVWESFRFDFRNDFELRMTLAQHVVPLSVRLKFHMRMDNPLLPEIKNRYPLAYAMAVEAAAVLADAYNARLSEEETGYIALAFALALERQKTGNGKKNILIVCASGAGSAHLLEHRYRREFGSYLDRIETCDVASIDRVDLLGIDYVFTTVPLDKTLPVPVQEVTFFLDDADLNCVRQVLRSEQVAPSVFSYFDRTLFFPHLDCRTKQSAIDTLCAAAIRERSAPANLRELVWRREEFGCTSFGNHVAMPHPMMACTDETFVCVGLTDRDIEWMPGVPVRAIFLVCVSRREGKDLQDFYDRMARLLTSEEAIDKLISQQSFEVLLELLSE